MSRRLVALLGLLAGLLGAGLLLAAPALAHASVVRSDPADGSRLTSAPSKVTITFDEDVGLGGIGYLHVTNASGRRVDAGPAVHPGGNGTEVTDTLRPGLGDSAYTASFRVISADSHPVAGTIAFVVGHGALVHGTASTSASDGTTATAFDVSRWISYGGLALLGGAWLLFTVWPQGRSDPRAAGLARAGIGVTALGAVLELVLQGPYAAGYGPGKVADLDLLGDTLRTNYGQLHCARLVLLAALAVVLVRVLRHGSGRLPQIWTWLAGLLAIGVAVTFSASGHADTTSPRALSIPLDVLHLLAMGAWLGGLIMLLGAVLPRHEPAELRVVLPTFSTVAFTSVVLLAATGTYAAWRGVGTVHALFTTSYGLLVVGKVALFVGLVLLGNLSRRGVQRRFIRREIAYAMTAAALDEPVETDGATDAVEAERLRRAVYVEVVVGLLVLALTAILVAQPRGEEALAAQYREPVTVTAPLGGSRSVVVTSDSGTHGAVELTFTIAGATSRTRLTATATQQQAQLGPVPIRLSPAAVGTYTGSANLPVAGAWDIDLTVTTSAFDATTTDTTLHLR